MASRIEHRADLAAPAATVHAALVDRAYLLARLAEVGGDGARLVDLSTSGETVSYRLRQSVPADRLPSLARSVLPGDLVVDRAETWTPSGDGSFAGTTTATVSGVPGEIKGAYRLADSAAGSTWGTKAEVKVRIPFVGGKIEGVIAEQVTRLLEAEAGFTAAWLAR